MDGPVCSLLPWRQSRQRVGAPGGQRGTLGPRCDFNQARFHPRVINMHGAGAQREGREEMSWEKMNQMREAGLMQRRMMELFMD